MRKATMRRSRKHSKRTAKAPRRAKRGRKPQTKKRATRSRSRSQKPRHRGGARLPLASAPGPLDFQPMNLSKTALVGPAWMSTPTTWPGAAGVAGVTNHLQYNTLPHPIPENSNVYINY